jgi:UPF0716 protein FxsA
VRRSLLVIAATVAVLAVVEVLVFVLVGRLIGVPWTIALILATSLLGAIVLRREGARSWRAFRDDLRSGRPPGPSATEGLAGLVGGLLLVLPGFVTDVLGILFVLPPTRHLAGRVAQSVLTRRLSPSAATSLFGPRTVRARTGPPSSQQPPPPPSSGSAPSAGTGEVVEGEIIDPRP